MKQTFFWLLAFAFFLSACKSGSFNLIKPASPHQVYERKLKDAGLDKTFMGNAWITKAKLSLENPVPIVLPYQERGYFAAENIEAAVFNFNLQIGQKLIINLQRKPTENFKVYVDLHLMVENSVPKLVASIDTLGSNLEVAIDKTGSYVVRLQPELLSSGAYTLVLTTGPSLSFPLKAGKANQIQSLFGDGRDENTRKHEGIDIFAPFRTPVIAVSGGRVTAVNENNLGGKVVWFRPDGKDYTLYYAHLDEQTVSAGQLLNYGDTIGRMGNTGNAKTTPPHLHFGIYTNNGAIDPFPFINPKLTSAPEISAITTVLNTNMRTISKGKLQNTNQMIESGAIVRIQAASENRYRVELPDGSSGYILGKQLASVKKPLKKLQVSAKDLNLFERPDSLSAIKLTVKKGNHIAVLGNYGDFQYVETPEKIMGWITIDKKIKHNKSLIGSMK